MTTRPLPPIALAQAPELATLAVLDAVLHVTVLALVAEHPTLDDELGGTSDEPATLSEARRLLRRIHRLQRGLADYQLAVLDALAPPPVDEDLPF